MRNRGEKTDELEISCYNVKKWSLMYIHITRGKQYESSDLGRRTEKYNQ